MGTVYDCRDPVIGRRVAIKTVSKEVFDKSESEALLGRFKQEAQAAGRLNHPGVVSIYDYGENDEVAFIAMEYISGKELKKYFDEGEKFDLKRIVRIMTEILDALDHAHRNKVVHRDIKPANIMITEDGRVKVADFGVAKIESSMMTQVGTRVGTPAYMSPEQHKMLSVDGRSDLFSCGVILYQFLTGSRPFTGGSHTIAQQILTQTPIPPSEVNVALPAIWDSIVRKALAKRRDERFLTARDFIEALQHGLNTSPSAIDGLATSFSDGPHDASSRSSRDTGADASRGGAATNSGKNDRTDVHMESELEFWKEIKDSDIAEDFAAFVDSFPAGRFSHLAKRRLEKLRQATDRIAQEETALPTARVPAPTPQPIPKRGDAATDQEAHRAAQERAEREAKQHQREEAEARARREAAEREAKERAEREAKERAEREAKERAEREAKERAEREAKERAEREAKERAEREAKERAEREAKERAEREAKERAEREAEERARKEALQREAERAAAEKARKEEQEKSRRETEAQRKREQEAQAKRAEEERKVAAQAKRQRDAELEARSGAQAKRDAVSPIDPDATEIRPAPGKKPLGTPIPVDDPDATMIRSAPGKGMPGALPPVDDPDATMIRPALGKSAPVDDPDATLIRAEAATDRDIDATFIQYPGDQSTSQPKGKAPGQGLESRKSSGGKASESTPDSTAVDIDLSDMGSDSASPTFGLGTGKKTALSAPANTPAKSPAVPVTAKTAAPTVAFDAKVTTAAVTPLPLQAVGPAPAAVRPASTTGRANAVEADEPEAEPKVRNRSVQLVAGVAVVLAVAGAGWVYFSPGSTPSPVNAEKAATESPRTAQTQESAPTPLPRKDAEPKATSDKAAEKVAADAAKSADAQKAAELAEQQKREQEAQNRAAEKAAADKVAAAQSATEKAAAKAASDKLAADKLAAAKVIADKAAAERLAAEKAAADKRAADVAAAERAAAEKAAADKAAADKAATERVAAAKAAADKAAAEKAAADRVASAGSIADRIAAASSPAELYKRAVALRGEGKTNQAVPLLRQASSQGHGPSSRLLVTIFTDGAPDVRANFREVERYKAIAETQGER